IQRCGIRRDWTTEAFIDEAVEAIRAQVGEGRALLAMSGGVDSSVCAVLAHRALGDRLTCVFVDHGLMRKGEPEEVATVFRGKFGMSLRSLDASDRFLGKLAGVTDPEKKRKIIGEEFIRVFEEEAHAAGDPDYLIQGTIYPDIIESGWDGGKKVKAHHNVGGLPEKINFKGLVEPLKYLFKDEVRQVAVALGIPASIAFRQPFPGPGLGVRCIGELTREKLDILREADAIFRAEIVAAGLGGKEASQYFAVLTANRSVGVANDARTYAYTVALRAVNTNDFMTAKFVKLPMDLLERVSIAITEKVPQVNRVVYDITSKPPATIEWE
ncbi:MAG: glutamine-hydrolyzing GMP synthase, partial [Kiritimatiellae bacterium]|nr:glutamine-hydrolyzing GMP synthase [Kiritimatiellia bacterium]